MYWLGYDQISHSTQHRCQTPRVTFDLSPNSLALSFNNFFFAQDHSCIFKYMLTIQFFVNVFLDAVAIAGVGEI